MRIRDAKIVVCFMVVLGLGLLGACSTEPQREACDDSGGFASPQLAMEAVLKQASTGVPADLCKVVMKPVSDTAINGDAQALYSQLKAANVTTSNAQIEASAMPSEGVFQVNVRGAGQGDDVIYFAYEYGKKGQYRVAIGNFVGVNAAPPQ